MPWTPDVTDETLPADTDQALVLGSEVRKIKEYLTRVPIVSVSASATLTAAAAGIAEFHPASDVTARTRTIPSNASVPFKVGTSISWFNEPGAGNMLISIDTDTLYHSPSGATGTRTLAPGGIATATKVTSTKWMISGIGLS